MSKLDNLYTFYRRYCKEIANHRNGAVLTQLTLWEDGSGVVETKIYLPDDSNPFRIHTDEIIRFTSPGDGAKKLEELVDGKKDVPEGAGQADEGNMAASHDSSTTVHA